MDKRVDKGEDFKKSGMTLITEIDSERYLRKAKKLKDCLLYTSPSPRDAHESRMPSSA